MTHYRLTVVRVDDNPDFDAEKARAVEERERQQRSGSMPYHGDSYTVLPTRDTRTLDVMLTDEEYQRVKQAVIEGWK